MQEHLLSGSDTARHCLTTMSTTTQPFSPVFPPAWPHTMFGIIWIFFWLRRIWHNLTKFLVRVVRRVGKSNYTSTEQC